MRKEVRAISEEWEELGFIYSFSGIGWESVGILQNFQRKLGAVRFSNRAVRPGGAELFLQVLRVSPLEYFLFLLDITMLNFLLISVHWASSAERLHHALFTVLRCQEVRGQHGPRVTSGEAAFLVHGWLPSQHVLNSKKNERLSGFSYKGANPIPSYLILVAQSPLQSPCSNSHLT